MQTQSHTNCSSASAITAVGRVCAAGLLAGLLGTTAHAGAVTCDPAAPTHVVLIADDSAASPAQRDEAIAEAKDAIRQSARPGTRTILARAGKGDLEIVLVACLPSVGDGTGVLGWFFNPTEGRQKKDREELFGKVDAGIQTIAFDIGDRAVAAPEPILPRTRKLVRGLEMLGIEPGKMTLVVAAGRPGADPGPRGRADPEMALIVLATRYDNGKTLLARDLGAASLLVVDSGLPPERDREGCVVGRKSTLATVLFVDRTGSLAEGAIDILGHVLARELANLGPDESLEIRVLDETPTIDPPIRRACRDDRPVDDQAGAIVADMVARIGPPEDWGIGQNTSPLVSQIVAARQAWGAAPPARTVIASDGVESVLPLGDVARIDRDGLKAVWAAQSGAPIDGVYAGIALEWAHLPSVESTKAPRPEVFVDALFTLLNPTQPD